MTTIKDILSLVAAVPTLAPKPIFTSTPQPDLAKHACGEVNVFYTGFPAYHPMVIAQGWDPERVDYGLVKDTLNLITAGYNVHVVWAGPEISIEEKERRMDQAGVSWDATAVGFGVRGATMEPIVEMFEDVLEMYERKTPGARRVFNYNPESFVWSVAHRFPTLEDCEAVGKPGKLLGYEEICDERCTRPSASIPESAKNETKIHEEL